MAKDTLDVEPVCDEHDCFVIANGLKIAKRENRQWIPLEPGWTVVWDPYSDDDTIDIHYDPSALGKIS